MAAQDEREPGVVVMCSCLDPMVQDTPVQDESLPQTNSEPEMGAAAAEAAVYGPSPSLLRNPPPIPAETARPGTPDMAQICAMLAAMGANINAKMDGNTKKMDRMENKMDGMKKEMKANSNGVKE